MAPGGIWQTDISYFARLQCRDGLEDRGVLEVEGAFIPNGGAGAHQRRGWADLSARRGRQKGFRWD